MDLTKLNETQEYEEEQQNPESDSGSTATDDSPTDAPLQELEEGELYVLKNGNLEHIPRNDDDGMRRIRITEEAYQVAMEIGRTMRKELQGYKPDVSLVASALLLSTTTNAVQGSQIIV
jgi:hypothetical protein